MDGLGQQLTPLPCTTLPGPGPAMLVLASVQPAPCQRVLGSCSLDMAAILLPALKGQGPGHDQGQLGDSNPQCQGQAGALWLLLPKDCPGVSTEAWGQCS